MTRKECIDGMQRIIDEDRNKILVRIHAGYLIHAVKYLKDQPEVVRCKDCIHNGKVEKCVLAAIAAEKDFPLFMLDNHGEWFCADGKQKGTITDE